MYILCREQVWLPREQLCALPCLAEGGFSYFSRASFRDAATSKQGGKLSLKGGGRGEPEAFCHSSGNSFLILFSRLIFVLFNHFPDLLLRGFFFWSGFFTILELLGNIFFCTIIRVIFNSSIKLTIIVYISVSLFFFQLLTFWNIRINL